MGAETERARATFEAGLSPRERVAYLIGAHVGRGGTFPSLATIDELRERCGDARRFLCRGCRGPLPPRKEGQTGRPPDYCLPCRRLRSGAIGEAGEPPAALARALLEGEPVPWDDLPEGPVAAEA